MSYWTVDLKREIDGYSIIKHLVKLTAGEVFSLHFEERLLPGKLQSFDKSKWVFGDTGWSIAGEIEVQELIS